MQVLHDYEFEAAGFGMQLLHERGRHRLDQWYSDFVATDWRYVEALLPDRPAPRLDASASSAARSLIQPARRFRRSALRQVEVRFAF